MTKAKLEMFSGKDLMVEKVYEIRQVDTPTQMFKLEGDVFETMVITDFTLQMNPFNKSFSISKKLPHETETHIVPISPIEYVMTSVAEVLAFSVVRASEEHEWEVNGTELFADQVITEIRVTVQKD